MQDEMIVKQLILVISTILIFGLGCDYATNYDIFLNKNISQQESYPLSQVEIDRSLVIISQIADSYKLAQKTTTPKDIVHLHPIAVYRETDVGLVSGNVSLIIYTEEEGQSLVININGLSPNRQNNKKIVEEIKNQLHKQLCSEFGEERVVISDSPEIIKIAG